MEIQTENDSNSIGTKNNVRQGIFSFVGQGFLTWKIFISYCAFFIFQEKVKRIFNAKL